MKRPEPFYRPARRRWYVQIDGKQINLGPDEKQAFERYHRLMAARSLPRLTPTPGGHYTVISVLDAYLDWLHNRVLSGDKASRTYDWYKHYLNDFASFCTLDFRVRDLTVEQLQPSHVYQWVDSHPGWKTGKRGAITAVQRALSWAAQAGLLKSIGGNSPLRAVEKPESGRREQLVSEQEYTDILTLAHDQEFRDLLELSWETGCRPHELFTVQASYADLDTARWVFPIRRDGGCVAVGWPALGNLSWVEANKGSRERLQQLLAAKYPTAPQAVGRATTQVTNFVAVMAKGDYVLDADGATVLGVSRVAGPYAHDPASDFPHWRQVQWPPLDEWKMPQAVPPDRCIKLPHPHGRFGLAETTPARGGQASTRVPQARRGTSRSTLAH